MEASLPITIATAISAPAHVVTQLLVANPSAAFGKVDGTARSFDTELTVDLGHGVSTNQMLAVDVGSIRESATGVAVAISWHAADHRWFFPSFDGHLMISEGNVGPSTEIRISGTFTPAAGPAAKFGDATAARRLAQRTVAALLLTVAATLTNFCTVNA